QLQEIHEAVRGLTGLTIVNQGPKFVTIENFVEPTRFPIDGLLRRLHYLTSRMEKLALGVISGDAKGNIEEVARMELEVDRLYWLVVRQLLLAAQNRTISGRIGVTEPRHLRAVSYGRTDCSRSSFGRSNTLRSTTAASRRSRSIGRSNGPFIRGPQESSRLRRGSQRTVPESDRSSSARGPSRVVASEFLHRPRLSRPGLRELGHEDYVLHVCQEGIEVLLDGSLKFTAELRAELIGGEEPSIARRGIAVPAARARS